LEDKLDKVAICHQYYLTYTASTLPRKLLMGLKLQNMRTSNSYCEICTWSFAIA